MRTSFFLSIVLIVTSVEFSFAATLTVGPGQDYSLLEQAAPNAQPGDTILVYEDAYTGVENLNNIQGTANDWIYITAAPGQNVVYTGATEAWHLTNCTYLHISGFTYEQQTGNGVNTDDGGDYSTPTHHIIYENCTFQNMAGTGNNDLLKLSGLSLIHI